MAHFSYDQLPQVYIIHDQSEWLEPHRSALKSRGVPFTEWDLNDPNWFDISKRPPAGIYFNRASPSSHIRGNRYAMELAASVVQWLERFNCVVINGSESMRLEMSKIVQELELSANGIPIAKSSMYSSRKALLDSLKNFPERFDTVEGFCVKHNRGGSGSGVRLFDTVEQAINYVESDNWESPIDGITLVQQRIRSPENCMYRLEYVDGELIYIVRIDTSSAESGAVVNNCPADSCSLKELRRQRELKMQRQAASANGQAPVACPLKFGASQKFKIVTGFQHPILDKITNFVASKRMGTVGVEIILNAQGDAYVIDFNATNTNYNSSAEKRANMPLKGSTSVADMLNRYLSEYKSAQALRFEHGMDEPGMTISPSPRVLISTK